MMTHNTSTCTWCNGEMDAALAHDAVVRVVGRPEKANFAPAGSSGQATADFPKPTEIAHFAKRKRPASRKYVVAEDNGVTKAVQQAVDDGCINAGPDDNQWDWRKPIVLASWGTREHSPATPQVLPNIETAVPGVGGVASEQLGIARSKHWMVPEDCRSDVQVWGMESRRTRV